jgi:uncharacterized membrane protein (DUF4010 family)
VVQCMKALAKSVLAIAAVCHVCRYMGASHDQEVALTLGMAYLAYWVTGIPCKGSGGHFFVNTRRG